MEEEKTVGLVETFDTGELSTELIPPNFTDPDDLFYYGKYLVIFRSLR